MGVSEESTGPGLWSPPAVGKMGQKENPALNLAVRAPGISRYRGLPWWKHEAGKTCGAWAGIFYGVKATSGDGFELSLDLEEIFFTFARSGSMGSSSWRVVGTAPCQAEKKTFSSSSSTNPRRLQANPRSENHCLVVPWGKDDAGR